MWSYPVVLTRDRDGRVLVDFPDFPEAHTYGDDEEEALVRARDALATIVDAYIRDRQPIPYPSAGHPAVRLPALTAAKVELYRTMRATRTTKTQLARRLNWHLPQVDRLLQIDHNSRVDQLEAAFTALGKELCVSAVDRERVDAAWLWAGTVRAGARRAGSRSRAGGAVPRPRYLLGPERPATVRAVAKKKKAGRKSRRK